MSQELFVNGVNADGTIGYDIPIDSQIIARVARGEKLTRDELNTLRLKKQNALAHFGVAEGVDPEKLDSAGWGVIFPAGLSERSCDAIKEALKPLLEHRKAQAGECYQEYIGPERGVGKNESKADFLKRYGRGPGPARPMEDDGTPGVPYYLLIVGSPEAIPFSFQYQLDVQYAVGRIFFERLEDYYRYARSVVEAETKGLARARRAAFFGVANADDRATEMSSKLLIPTLAKAVNAKFSPSGWGVDVIPPEQTGKATLSQYMGGERTPSLLFTAGHGINFKLGDERQLRHQGSLVTQEWPGPRAGVPLTEDMYFSADDIPSDADVFGMLAFMFACYGGGTPRSDNFWQLAFAKQRDIAPYAFVAQLPMRLLSHPRGGALGVFAHVERAWGSSIVWDNSVQELESFNSMIQALLNGKPAGFATEYFNERYAEISAMLTEELQNTSPENQDDVKIAGMWTSNNDARNYAFLGDPAVRLVTGERETPDTDRQAFGEVVTQYPEAIRAASTQFQPDLITYEVVGAGPAVVLADEVTSGESFGFLTRSSTTDGDSSEAGKAVALSGTFREFVEKLGSYMSKALDDATSLEVATYISDDLGTVVYESGKFAGSARLRALTRVKVDGDSLVCVPQDEDGQVDMALWQIHMDMVRQAQETRNELMKTLVSAASNLAGFMK
ncbi:MAG TPA: hypothetical protein VFY26_16380 [Anaerolineales bacterium]|nr:hypothetical protein [Anaerolineales bacterium]